MARKRLLYNEVEDILQEFPSVIYIPSEDSSEDCHGYCLSHQGQELDSVALPASYMKDNSLLA
jgi:hypothetical protein